MLSHTSTRKEPHIFNIPQKAFFCPILQIWQTFFLFLFLYFLDLFNLHLHNHTHTHTRTHTHPHIQKIVSENAPKLKFPEKVFQEPAQQACEAAPRGRALGGLARFCKNSFYPLGLHFIDVNHLKFKKKQKPEFSKSQQRNLLGYSKRKFLRL